jgi:hypothetical protein
MNTTHDTYPTTPTIASPDGVASANRGQAVVGRVGNPRNGSASLGPAEYREKLQMRKFVGAVSIIGALLGCAIALSAPSSADPGPVCPRTFVFGSGGSRCDSPPNPDGSFTRCDTVDVLGFGGTNCYTVYP